MGAPLDVRVVQVGYDARDIRHHVDTLKGLIAEHRTADLVVFPELCLHGHPSAEKPEGFLYRRMRAVYGTISSDLYRHVRDVDGRVIIGEMRRAGDRLLNVATYVDRRVTQHYVKTHVHWTEDFVPGRRLRVFDAPFGPVGINVCFDAAFPEVWRASALLGAEVAVNISAVPASFPSRLVHRRMSSAALDNQQFVVYANRPGPIFSGESAIFDPRGDTVAALHRQPGVLAIEIDLEEVSRWRAEERIYAHRRPQLYRSLSGVRRPPEAGPARGHDGTPGAGGAPDPGEGAPAASGKPRAERRKLLSLAQRKFHARDASPHVTNALLHLGFARRAARRGDREGAWREYGRSLACWRQAAADQEERWDRELTVVAAEVEAFDARAAAAGGP